MKDKTCNCRQPGLGGDCDGSCTHSVPSEDRWADEIGATVREISEENRKLRADLADMTADMLAAQAQRNEWRERYGSLDGENAELRRQSAELRAKILQWSEDVREFFDATNPSWRRATAIKMSSDMKEAVSWELP